jgi:hypothetical protein
MLRAIFAAPCLTTFCRLDELGLEAVGQRLEPDQAVIECRVAEQDPWCQKCGSEGVVRDTVTRRLAHEPFGHRPTTLLVRVRRYRCDSCERTCRQDTSKVAAWAVARPAGAVRTMEDGLRGSNWPAGRPISGLGDCPDPAHRLCGGRLDRERGPRDGTNVVDFVVQGGLLDREQATALLTPLPPNPALLAGG